MVAVAALASWCATRLRSMMPLAIVGAAACAMIGGVPSPPGTYVPILASYRQITEIIAYVESVDPTRSSRLWYADTEAEPAGRIFDSVATSFLLCPRMVGLDFPVVRETLCDGKPFETGLRIVLHVDTVRGARNRRKEPGRGRDPDPAGLVKDHFGAGVGDRERAERGAGGLSRDSLRRGATGAGSSRSIARRRWATKCSTCRRRSPAATFRATAPSPAKRVMSSPGCSTRPASSSPPRVRTRSRCARCCSTSGRATRSSCRAFTFVSTANAFVLRGARPVFADSRPDTLNLDEEKLPETSDAANARRRRGALRRGRV